MAKTLKTRCSCCNKTFSRNIRRIKENKKMGWKTYCSQKCLIMDRTKSQEIICEKCGIKIKRISSALSSHNYCSRSCAITVNNSKCPKRKREIQQCTNPKCTNELNLYNKKYCSRKCRWDHQRNYTKKDIIRLIQKKTKQLGRTPAKREMRLISDYCTRIFGTWNTAVIAAGLKPHRSHDNRMYKRSPSKAKDGHICDSISEVIIDNWLHAHHISHEINYKYPEGNYKSDWAIIKSNKIILIEYFGLANDSPRYDRTIKVKKSLCKKHKIHLIEIYPQDLYPKIKINNKFKTILV